MKRIVPFILLLLFCVAALAQGLPNFGGSQLPNNPGGGGGTGGAGGVANLTALTLASTAAYPTGVWRTTYGNGNGAPPLFYNPSASACTFNAGAGDGGAQVPSADGKCWIAAFPSGAVDVKQWGALSDGGSPIAGAYGWTATANGTTLLTVSSTNGMAAGQHISTIGWATRQATSLAIIPSGTTVVSVGSGNVVTSQTVPTMLTIPSVAWGDAVVGTNNTAAFQAMFDYGMQSGVADFYCLGNFKITDTLHVGWGAQGANGGLYGLRLSGGYRAGYNQLPGCTLYPTQTDRPAIDFTSGRQVGLYGVAIWGRLYNYLFFTMGSGSNLSSNVNDWLPPEFTPSGTSGGFTQHAPWAAVTVDAYAGTQPSPAYPNLTFPAWTGLSAQYGKSVTSDIELRNVNIDGFAVAFAVGLNTQNNGDFAKITNLNIAYNPYGLSVTNSQSRNVNISNIICGFNYTVIDQTTLGMQSGEFNGPISNIGCSPAYQMFNFGNLGLSGPLDISEIYCEGCVRVGNFVSNTSFNNLVDLKNSTFNLTETLHGQIPACFITATNAEIRMTGVNYNGNQRISNLFCGGAQTTAVLNGGGIQGAVAGAVTPMQLQAINYSGGMFAGAPRYNSSAINNWSVPQYYLGSYYSTASFTGAISSLTLTVTGGVTNGSLAIGSCIFTGAGVTANTCITAFGTGGGGNGTYTVNNSQSVGAEAMTASSSLSSYPHADVLTRGTLTNRFPMTQDMKTYVDSQGRSWQMTVPAPAQLVFPSSPGTQISVLPAYAGDTMTFNYCSVYQGGTNGIVYVIAPGDILYHFNSNTIFVVTSVGSPASDATNCTFAPTTSSVVTAVQQNNMTVAPGTNTWASNLNATPLLNSGNTALIKTGVVIPGQLEYGQFANGSTTVSNVSNGNGVVGTDLGTFYKNGDLVLAPFTFGTGSSPWPTSNAGGNQYATVIAANPGSITLGSAATASGLYPIFPYELSGRTVGPGPQLSTSYAPGLQASIVNTIAQFQKWVKSSTVDNLIGSASSFTCTGNPTITFYECGTSTTCTATPITIGTVTLTASGAAVAGSVTNPAITAGDYTAWAISAGTCTALDASATAQYHQNGQ
jgi:hypothetical protein